MSDRPGPFDPDRPDDEAARRLREVLSQEALAIAPSAEGLAVIREQIRAQRGGRRSWARAFQVGGAGLATAAVAVVAVLAVQHNGGSNNHAAVTVPSPDASSAPVTAAPATAAVASSTEAPYAVPVFYVDKRKDPQQLLFREIAQWPSSPQHTFVKDSVSAMLATPAQDPDYTSYWPTGTHLLSANITGDTTAVVDLSSEAADGPTGHGAISAQQMLYTIMAGAPKIDGLQLRIAGVPITSLWGDPVDATIKPLDTAVVWGHVWITQPTQDATVASSVTISGEATVFEANVNWEILRNGGLLKHGNVTASAGAPLRGTWSVTVAGLAPGPYTVRAYEISAKDSSITYVDDKAFTVD